MKNLIAWVEIPAKDMKRAVAFYAKILNIDLSIIDCGTEKMALLPDDAGAISEAPDFHPSKDGVLVSLNTGKELDQVIQRILDAGGQMIKAKTKIEAEGRGYFALFTDSEGNRLGLYGDA
jgi:predicted enzyme related to lactoylglutathione lyase